MPITLTPSQIRFLRKQAHAKKCIVTVGNAGLTDSVIQEADSSLSHHELMKIKINASDKPARKAIIDKMCSALDASLVLAIGHVIAVYRPAKNPQLKLPK